jgi:HEAT repeat protein
MTFRRRIWAAIALAAALSAANGHAQLPPLQVSTVPVERGSDEDKRTALQYLRNLRTPEASRAAVPALRDRSEIVRATAAGTVVFLPPAEAAAVLIPLLSDRAPFVRREAAYALGSVGGPSALASLLALLRRDRDPEARSAAVIALGNIGDPSALDALVGLLTRTVREEDEFIRRSAARSIGQIARSVSGLRPTVTPQNFLPDRFKERAIRSIPLPQAPRLAALLSQVVRNRAEADDTRREAAFALGALSDTSVIPVLRECARSDDPYMAEICREGLLQLSPSEQT